MTRLRLALAFLLVAMSMAGCGAPPGFENQWQSMMNARARYEMCAAQHYRQIAACNADYAIYRAEQARYNADLQAKRSAAPP
jgi:hypothetical protein